MPTYSVGSVIALRGPRGGKFIATAPDGSEVHVPANTGSARLWVPQPGVWTYRWTGDPPITGEIVVTAEPAPTERARGRLEGV
jgi:hypothetical protein